MNKVFILGNLGDDPKLRYTEGGAAVANFSLATNESWVDKNDEKQERTEWHRVVVWNRQAETCDKYLSKGDKALVEGKLQTREWEDKEGNTKYTTEIVARNVQFITTKNKGSEGSQGGSQESSPPDFNDDDIPF